MHQKQTTNHEQNELTAVRVSMLHCRALSLSLSEFFHSAFGRSAHRKLAHKTQAKEMKQKCTQQWSNLSG